VPEEDTTERLKDAPARARQEGSDHTASPPPTPLRGTRIEALRQFFGIWTAEEAEEIKRIIEEECERIDPDDWSVIEWPS
jgi:hypothetical protein